MSSTPDLYKPLSDDFILPSNRDVGGEKHSDPGPFLPDIRCSAIKALKHTFHLQQQMLPALIYAATR